MLYGINTIINKTEMKPFTVADDVVFDGFGISNSVYQIKRTNWDNLPRVEINSYERPLNNGGVVTSKYFRQKFITFSGTIRNPGSLQQAIDLFKSRLRGKEKFLDIRFNDTMRRIKASVESIDIPKEHYHIDFVPFSVTFVSQDPFFYKTEKGVIFFDSITGDIENQEIENVGLVEVPVIFRYVGGSTSNVTKLKFTLGGEDIEVEETVGDGDILEIDGEERIVTLNGVQKDFDGVFAEFPLGKSPFSVDFTGTVDGDVSILYNVSYL